MDKDMTELDIDLSNSKMDIDFGNSMLDIDLPYSNDRNNQIKDHMRMRIRRCSQLPTKVYVIEVTVGPYTWTVRHRYSEFLELNDKLVAASKLDKNLLPPKKLIGNQSEAFVKKRQNDLEVYIQTVLYFLAHRLPPVLASFLDFHRYEIHGITQSLAEELYNRGEVILQNKEVFQTTPLHLYALTERLKLPEPTCDTGDVKKDIGHILDFITRLKHLKVYGSRDHVGNSNIDMNELKFDLVLFKSLQSIELVNYNPFKIGGLETIKQTVDRLRVHRSVSSIREFLLQTISHWRADDGMLLVAYWELVRHADFSYNTIISIDDSVQLMPNVETLNLSHNSIETIQHLQWLSSMTSLDLSHNEIKYLDSLHTKLGNLKCLNLAGNKLDSLKGLSKLFSLCVLDVSNNKISEVTEIKPVGGLPCLENLMLVGNPVTTVLDYRKKVLEIFADRINEVCLDNQHPTQKEIDTVAVLQAIKKSKDKREKTNLSTNPVSSSVDISSSSETQHSSDVNLTEAHAHNLAFTHPAYKNNTTLALDHSRHEELPHNIFFQDVDKEASSWQPKGLEYKPFDTNLRESANVRSSSESSIGSLYPGCGRPPLDVTVTTSEKSLFPLIVNSSDLPLAKNKDFVNWLPKRLLGNSSDDIQEKILCVIWCQVAQYSNPRLTFPAAVILTERRIFIQRLRNSQSEFPLVPDMETYYILPLCNIQQVVIGCDHSYIRVEESFVGSSGTFLFITSNTTIILSFIEALKAADKGLNNPDLDVLDLSKQSEIVHEIEKFEETKGFSTGRLVFVSVVRNPANKGFSFLLLSENTLYLTDYQCVLWPPPTFDKSHMRINFLQVHPLMRKISDISMYEFPSRPPPRPSSRSISEVIFEEFGMSMLFHIENTTLQQRLNILFGTTLARDNFLDSFTNLRSQQANRFSLPVEREAPVGGNETISDRQGANDVVIKASVNPQKVDESDLVSSIPVVTGRHTDVSGHSDDKGSSSNSEGGGKLPPPSELMDKHLLETEAETTGQKPVIIVSDSNAKSSQVGVATPYVESTFLALSAEWKSYDLCYVTKELADFLQSSVQDYSLRKDIPSKMKFLQEMTGRELVNYFHKNISTIGSENEELHYVLWTFVVPYLNPSQEIITLVMFSNKSVYLVSNDKVVPRLSSKPSWKTHARHKSDSVLGLQNKREESHHLSGIIHEGSQATSNIVKSYYVFSFAELQQVNVGLFDQCYRLTGTKPESVFTLLTRDSVSTGIGLRELTSMLSLFASTPILERSLGDMEQDFYKAFRQRNKSTLEELEYVHPSHVKFCYPGEEAIDDALFLINQTIGQVHDIKPSSHIWIYIMCYVSQSSPLLTKSLKYDSRTIILTTDVLCIALEDVVSYPLPDFVRGLPDAPKTQVLFMLKIENIKRVIEYLSSPNVITIVYIEESDDFDVDVTLEYFTRDNGMTGRDQLPDKSLSLWIQSMKEKCKLLQMLAKLWKGIFPKTDFPLQESS